MSYGITLAGFVKKPASVIRQELTGIYRTIYGDDIQTSDGPIAQEIGVFSEREALLWELCEAAYLARTRDGAFGKPLDDVNSLIGVGRLPATRSTVTLTLATTGAVNTIVPASSQVRQAANDTLWETTAAATIPAAVTVVNATCTTIAYQSGNTVRYTFTTTDLSAVVAGDMLFIADAAIAGNNGLVPITAVNDGSNYVDVTNLNRSDDGGDESGLSIAAVLTDGYITVPGRAVNTGANAAAFGAIRHINTPLSGWDYARNMETSQTGRSQETDTDYRRRAAASTVSTDGGTLAAIGNRIVAEVTGVTAVFARENRTSSTDGNGLPPHSINITVIGGADADIAALIYNAKPAGANTFGNTSATVTNDYGDTETIFFSRITQVPIYFDVTVTTTAEYPVDGDDQIKAALVEYGDVLTPGDDVINPTAIGYIMVNVPGITAITVLQGISDPPVSSANIAISGTQSAVITTGNIEVNS
jgi:uncharacterized phage protein gp47/JayE